MSGVKSTCYSLSFSGSSFIDTGGVATLVGDPPNLMIGSAFGIDFNTFLIHMGWMVLVAWMVVLFMLRYIFKEELATEPQELDLQDRVRYRILELGMERSEYLVL